MVRTFRFPECRKHGDHTVVRYVKYQTSFMWLCYACKISFHMRCRMDRWQLVAELLEL